MTTVLLLACRAPEVEVLESGIERPLCQEDDPYCCEDLRYWSGAPGEAFDMIVEGTLSEGKAERVLAAAEGQELVLLAYLSGCSDSLRLELHSATWRDQGEAHLELGAVGPFADVLGHAARPWILVGTTDERVTSMSAYRVDTVYE